jgi:tetratricopeptide (TPR) repeat protein
MQTSNSKKVKNLFFLSGSLTFCFLFYAFVCKTYALNLDKVKVYFLNGDYKAAILEGEKLMGQSAHNSGSDELYYILGLSYLKDGNYLRASDIFEIILGEFKNSRFRDEAKLGLGDTYFLRGYYEKAEAYYKDLLSSDPGTKLKPQLYYRLSQAGFKRGDTAGGLEYSQKLKREFPANIEAKMNNELCPMPDNSHAGFYYTVQVGSFSKKTNAGNLAQKLNQKGYVAFVEEGVSSGNAIYRVKVGKLATLAEAQALKYRLSQEGYPTKICP